MKKFIGTSGYSYDFWGPVPNVDSIKNFYSIKTKTKWLKCYSEHLKSVEINFTRYRKLTPKMCEKWIKQVPSDFTFTIKASTYITHGKKLLDFKNWWDEFYPCIVALGDRFCSVLFQFHPTFYCTEANIKKLEVVKNIIPPNIKCAFEFRSPCWYQSDKNLDMFSGNWTQVILFVPEIRHQKKFNFGKLAGGIHIGVINKNFTYLRFHGTVGYSTGTYGEDRMLEVLNLINNINPKTICGYFNNTDTWTLRPGNIMEGNYGRLPFGKELTPSAIYDSKTLATLLS